MLQCVAIPAGVGKTHLALEALREAEQEGCSTAWAVATRAAASIPFGPFANLLPQLRAESLGRLDPLGQSRLDQLRQISDTLTAHATGRRVVIGIDDAHLLDDASAALVHQLAMSGTVFVVVTVRAGERTPDSIVALWKDGLAERLELGPLSEDEVFDLLPRVLKGQVDTPTVARLWHATRGNALFLRELVLAGLEGGALVEAGGVWCWKGAMAMSLRLQEIVSARLGTLEGDELALMEVVAHGEPVSASLLETLLPPETLEKAERRGLVTIELSGRRTLVRPAHPLYGAAVLARCPVLRTRTVRRDLATALEASGARRADDLLRLATYRLESGEPGRPGLLLAGAQRAFAVFDLPLSERLARAAMDAGGGVAARLALAQTLVEEGRGAAEALEVLSGIDHLDLSEEQTAVASGLRAYALSVLGQPDEAEQVLLRTERVLTDAFLRDDLSAMRAWILYMAGQPQKTIAMFETLERTAANERACVRAAVTAIMACAVAGRVEQAVAAAEQWLPRARNVAADIPLAPFAIKAGQGGALVLSGRLSEAETVANEAFREAVSRNAEDGRGLAAFILGVVALSRGTLSVALRWLREAAAASRQPSRFRYRPLYLAWLAQACVLSGDLAGARGALAEAETAIDAGVASFQLTIRLARLWLSVGEGDVPRTRSLALEAADEAEASGQYLLAIWALNVCTLVGEPEVARLDRLAPLVEGPFALACVLHAAALAAGDGQRLDQAAADFAVMGVNLFAAQAAAQAVAAHGAQGENGAMLASRAMALRHLEACKGLDKSVLPSLAALPSG